MDDRYLWDRTGPPDSEIERLEELLGRFRGKRPAPPVPQRPRWSASLLAVAATLLFVGAGGLWIARARARGSAWTVERLQGAPAVGAERIAASGRLAVGEWLETDGSSRARLEVGAIGEIEVEPNSRLLLVRARLTEQRVALARGSISARIWAPPRLFFVETPSALAVDLGCAYTLTVDDEGQSLLSVTSGWVELDDGGRESLVPAGARCQARPGVGPGTPYFADASPAFREALERLDFGKDEAQALGSVLAWARPRDGLTLWHLLARLEGPDLARVYDRLAALVPPPAEVTREGIGHRDDRMLELWRERLDLPWFEKEKDPPFWRKAWRRLWTS